MCRWTSNKNKIHSTDCNHSQTKQTNFTPLTTSNACVFMPFVWHVLLLLLVRLVTFGFFFLFRNVYSYYLLFSLAVQHNRWRVRAFTVKNSCSYYHSLCRHRFSIRSQAMMVTIYSTRVKCLCLLVFGFGFGFGFSVSLLAKSETYTRRISSNWILCCVALLSVCFHSFIH